MTGSRVLWGAMQLRLAVRLVPLTRQPGYGGQNSPYALCCPRRVSYSQERYQFHVMVSSGLTFVTVSHSSEPRSLWPGLLSAVLALISWIINHSFIYPVLLVYAGTLTVGSRGAAGAAHSFWVPGGCEAEVYAEVWGRIQRGGSIGRS